MSVTTPTPEEDWYNKRIAERNKPQSKVEVRKKHLPSVLGRTVLMTVLGAGSGALVGGLIGSAIGAPMEGVLIGGGVVGVPALLKEAADSWKDLTAKGVK